MIQTDKVFIKIWGSTIKKDLEDYRRYFNYLLKISLFGLFFYWIYV